MFGRKKNQTPVESAPEPPLQSRLQELTGTDTDMYQSLSRLLFMDPKRITTSLEDAVSQANKFESMGDKPRAEVWYRIAGGISLYRGDVEGVRKFFQKASDVVGNTRAEYKTITSRAEDAINIARKYYENL